MREKLVQVQDEKDCILLIAELLKKGDFSVKNLLIDLMNTTKDDAVLNLCIRLFCSVCTHEDLENPQNLNFLANVSELGALTFASSAINSLSYEVIPYLLALWEDWEDTDVAVAIRDSLDSYLDYYDVLGEEADLDEVGQYYLDKVQSVDKRLYYYEKGPIFLGDLTKIIFQRLYMAANQKERFALFIQPSLLSVLSGYHFPLEYGQEVSEQDLRKAQEFVDFLAQKEWKKSTKYFYGYNL
ncbi:MULTISPECIES: Imm47 family immunity protein [Streptococcus]|uniref:Imm47 family immunity protein n=1 Tax=Streptococcus TaxID=1301 RepID=UPI000DBE0DA4|nr:MULTISPECIES: Imm47 family immunity protein [Streptococcus]WNU94016.1 Imm47 family immunity protein [Streptococcus sp. DTU_2020_1000888_1_SI_GRL_NUU_041A]